MSEGKNGRIVFMPDMEYRAWVNRNTDLVDEIIKTGKINILWLRRERNKEFLIRRLHELGYQINLE